MTYTKRSDVPAVAGETVVQLETGLLVAVSCERKLLGDRICFHTRARAIDAGGDPLPDSAGSPITREFKHTAPVGMDADAVARDCMLAALGEPTSIDLPPLALASYSIRVAVEAALVVGPVDGGAVL